MSGEAAMEGERRSDDDVLLDFLARYGDDCQAGEVHSLSHYQRLFPGHEDLVAAEFSSFQEVSEFTAAPESLWSVETPKSLGPYRILRKLGQGGQGVVYLAEDERLSRPVALKVLTAFGMAAPETMTRFRREAEVASRLDHPGICTVYEAESVQGIPYIAMRYVEGVTLSESLAAQRIPTPKPGTPAVTSRTHDKSAVVSPGSTIQAKRTLVSQIEQVARALHVAHSQGVVHRDVKPGNIMITATGQPVVLDFGLAHDADEEDVKMTRTGDVLGTPVYMSPEQIDRSLGTVDGRTDIWALGVILFEGLTGERPFRAATRTALYQEILHQEPQRLRELTHGASADLGVIVETALQKDPDRRYASAEAMADDLKRFLSNEPILARPPSTWYHLGKFARRHRALVAAGLLLLVILIAAVVVSLGFAAEANSRAEEALENARLVREEADIVREINGFINDDLLSAVSPEAQGYDVKMRTVLDTAAKSIGGRFESRPRVAVTIRRTLARTYRALGAFETSGEHIRTALELARTRLGPDHLEFHRCQVELGALLLTTNQNEEAERILVRTTAALNRILGERHVESLDAAHWLGISLGEQVRIEEADRVFRRVRQLALETLGEDHPLAISALHSLAVNGVGACTVRHEIPGPELVEQLTEALERSRRVLGPDRAVTIRRLIDLASCRMVTGDEEGGEALYREAYQRSLGAMGAAYPTTLLIVARLAEISMRRGDFAGAEKTLAEVISSIDSILPKDSSHAVWIRVALAKSQAAQGKHQEAIDRLHEALSVARSSSALRYEEVGVATSLAVTYREWGKLDEAERWSKVASELRASTQ